MTSSNARHNIFHSRLKKQAGNVGLRPTSAVWKIARMKQSLRHRIFLQIVEEIDTEVFRTNITFPTRYDLAGMRPDQHTWIQQITNHLLGIRGVEFIDHSESNAHGQLRPCSLNRVASQEYDFQVRKMIHNSFDDLIGKGRVGRRDVTREKGPFMTKQPAVTIEIDMASHAQIFDALDKTSVSVVVGARRLMSLRPV